MSKRGNGVKDNMEDIADDASTLLAHAGEMTEEGLEGAKERLAAAMEAAKETYAQLQEKAVQGAKAADKVVRNNPYAAIGVAAGLGVLVGYLISRRK
ncbi:MAG: hypothetical protein JWQ71_567 [Pedosphaera sp.]|nr:hypothetical protein [Pedosphaera sp.]